MAAPTYPTFNGNPIFCSIDGSGNRFAEGSLWIPDYGQISQPIHFEGEVGNYTLFHGYPDMEWIFEGVLSAPTASAFSSIVQAIQTVIQSATSSSATYYTLVDTYGGTYPYAQVRHMTWVQAPHSQLGGGYAGVIRITGVIQGDTQFEAT